eukprot:gene435-95_t
MDGAMFSNDSRHGQSYPLRTRSDGAAADTDNAIPSHHDALSLRDGASAELAVISDGARHGNMVQGEASLNRGGPDAAVPGATLGGGTFCADHSGGTTENDPEEARDSEDSATDDAEQAYCGTLGIFVLLVVFNVCGIAGAVFCGSLVLGRRPCGAPSDPPDSESTAGSDDEQAEEEADVSPDTAAVCAWEGAVLGVVCLGIVGLAVCNGGDDSSDPFPIETRQSYWYDDSLVHRAAPISDGGDRWLRSIERGPVPFDRSLHGCSSAEELFAVYKEFMDAKVHPKRAAEPGMTSIVMWVHREGGVLLPIRTETDGPVNASVACAGEDGARSVVLKARRDPATSSGRFWECDFEKPGLYHVALNMKFSGWGEAEKAGDGEDVRRLKSLFLESRVMAIDVWLGESGLRTLEYAFAKCQKLLHVGVRDTSQVTNMGQMFDEAYFAQPVNSVEWDTRNVRVMRQMFKLTETVTPQTMYWDTGNVVDMEEMFSSAEKAMPETKWWDTSKVKNMRRMFAYATDAAPTTTWWDTREVTDCGCIFRGSGWRRGIPETRWWDLTKATSREDIFDSQAMSQGMLKRDRDGFAMRYGVKFRPGSVLTGQVGGVL